MNLPDLDYRGLFDASPNPYLVLDRALNIVGANKAYLSATKRELTDIVGRWAWDAFPTDPETLRLSIASFERVIRTRQPDTLALLRFDIPRPEADGGGFETRYWSIVATPVLNEAGEVELLLQHPIDVTELQRLRETVRLPEDERPAHFSPALTGIVDRAKNVHEANLALRADSARLRELFERSPSPIAVLAGKAHVFELANEAFYQLVGRRDIMGKALLEALPELVGQGINSLLDKIFDTGKPFVGRGLKLALQQQPNAPLNEVYHDVLYQPLFGPDGQVRAIFCQGNEVTEAYRAQVALRESQARLKEGMDAARMVVWDWDLPSDRLTLSENVAAIFGGKWDTVESLIPSLYPGDVERLRQRRLQTTPEHPRYEAEFRLIRPDSGRVVWLEIRAQVLFDSNGAQCHVKGVTLDITDRKQAEQALQESEYRLALALKAGGSAAWEMDVATGILRGEDLLYTMLGYEPGELTTLADWLAIIHEEDRPGVPELIDETVAGKRDKYAFEVRLRTKDGNWRWDLSQGVAAERDAQGRATRLVGTHTDITERKEAEAEIQRLNVELEERVQKRTAQLEQSNEALVRSNMELQRFAHATAHDLQTPLRSIVGFSQLLQREIRGRVDERADEWLTLVIDNTKRLQILIQEILAYARLDALARPFEPVNLEQVFEQVVSTLAAPINEAGAEVSRGDLPTLLADRTQMAQLLQNLIENGIKYNRSQPPRVSVTCERRDEEWIFAVTDNGIGIDPRYHGRIFEIFQRLHTHQEIPGTGIGLAICQRIVEHHGGRLWVESRPGEGSIFSFSLPNQAEGRDQQANTVLAT